MTSPWVSPLKVDTLELNVWGQWSEPARPALETARSLRDAARRGVRVAKHSMLDWCGQAFEINGIGGPHWQLVLGSYAFRLALNFRPPVRDPGDGTPQVQISIGSHALEAYGWPAYPRELLGWIEEAGLEPSVVRAARIDLAVDHQGPLLDDSLPERFTGRAQAEKFWETPDPREAAEREALAELEGARRVVHKGGLVTGVAIGKRGNNGSAYGRLYDKLAELSAKRTSSHVLDWWSRFGFRPELIQPGETVRRMEWELRSKWLRERGCDDWRELSRAGVLEALWAELVSRPDCGAQGFVRLVTADGPARIRARETAPEWALLWSVVAEGTVSRPRVSLRRGDADALWRSALGALSTAIASQGWNPGEAKKMLSQAWGEVQREALRKRKLLEGDVNVGRAQREADRDADNGLLHLWESAGGRAARRAVASVPDVGGEPPSGESPAVVG